MKADLIEELRWRGMLNDMTDGVEDVLRERKLAGYVGFDPTAESLHVGNLVPIMGLVHLQRHGHQPIALVGGATGMVGDPSGRSKERNLLADERLQRNLAGIREQLGAFLDFKAKANPAKLVNNIDWIGPMSFLEFIRDVGKNFPVGYMLSKESVKRRIEGEGLSFTEFSYMLVQAYDFRHLRRAYNCELQMGGGDQWGNITAGIELIRRMDEAKAYGLTLPLITTATGAKFGKTAEGAVWLDPNMTSPYKFYQYWLNVDDADALRYLKFFTLLEEAQVEELAAAQAAAPHKRDVQRRLAAEVTRMVHGDAELERAVRASEAMFGGDLTELSARDIGDVFGDVPSTELAKAQFEGEGMGLLDALTLCGVTKSKGEARRLVQGGGVYVNNRRTDDPFHRIPLDDAVAGSFLVLRKGSKHYHLIKIKA